jgi:hypothetical protein
LVRLWQEAGRQLKTGDAVARGGWWMGGSAGRGAPKKNKIESDVYLADDKLGRLVLFIFYF